MVTLGCLSRTTPFVSPSTGCGDAIDNREKTIASFEPFADFNQPSFSVGLPANPLVGVNGAYTRYEIHFNETELSAFAANGWAQAQNLKNRSAAMAALMDPGLICCCAICS
jgi:hypothetical protein